MAWLIHVALVARYDERRVLSVRIVVSQRASYHHGNLRRALLDAALRVLEKRDAKSLSLREVARQAKVSHTAPYRHFAHKQALLAAVAEEGFMTFGEYLKAAKDKDIVSPLQALQHTGAAYVRYALEHPTHYRVMFGRDLEDCEAYPSLVSAANATFDILVEIVRAGQVKGVIKSGDTRQLALGAWAQVHGLAMLLLDGQLPSRSIEENEALVVQIVQSSIAGLAIASES
ncbi:MAG: TetR/AcrR family transcriptional regulator [Cyanobacteria bacterium J06642_2]